MCDCLVELESVAAQFAWISAHVHHSEVAPEIEAVVARRRLLALRQEEIEIGMEVLEDRDVAQEILD